MRIIKRHINSNGEIYGYTIESDGKERLITAEGAKAISEFIQNAVLLSNGSYRAKKGHKIETVVDNKKYLKAIKEEKPKEKGEAFKKVRYYGEDLINTCRTIRKHAGNQNLIIDMGKHKSNDGYNTHLFNLIQACGISVKDYITAYLSVIQPYSLINNTENMGKDRGKRSIWVFDIGYKVKLYIKIDIVDPNKPIVVSFHESNTLEKPRKGGNRDFSDKPCAVIVNQVKTYTEGAKQFYNVAYTVQRGFIRLGLNSITEYMHNGVALVNYKDIKEAIDNRMEKTFNQILELYNNQGGHMPDYINDYNYDNLSLMSYGYATVNQISFMIDLYEKYTDKKSRILLCGVVNEILEELEENRLKEIKEGLIAKATNKRSKLLSSILEFGEY